MFKGIGLMILGGVIVFGFVYSCYPNVRSDTDTAASSAKATTSDVANRTQNAYNAFTAPSSSATSTTKK